ncbi:tRNA A-37 threonylcarbamoyl transferase component Bud32 [Streptomyces sp. V1I1]|nr:serine/threonine-protein kinase [Streptomyces sp. V1I1]MDQ0943536.1 tRNA A-37 threonylcarbamoyl transferase component Bud32 [Streptomyces sp. V1I1]
MPGIPGLLVAGRYRLDESIGQGGMGRVWRAADVILDRPVAVKEMRMDDADAEDTRIRRERTLREARATARIDHANVVRVYDVVEESDRLWIVMELVESRSLERLLVEDGPVSAREAARIGLGVVAALREVHAVGVLHRDIKPGNILLSRSGRVVLTDFGIAAIQDAKALTVVGMLVGSPDYMAPERVGGRPQGPASDLWSLGATLCAAVAGQSPFARPTTLATLHAVLYEEPELPSAAGPLTPVLASLLVKDPEARPTLDALETLLTRAASAYVPTLLVPPPPPPLEPAPLEPAPLEPVPAEPSPPAPPVDGPTPGPAAPAPEDADPPAPVEGEAEPAAGLAPPAPAPAGPEGRAGWGPGGLPPVQGRSGAGEQTPRTESGATQGPEARPPKRTPIPSRTLIAAATAALAAVTLVLVLVLASHGQDEHPGTRLEATSSHPTVAGTSQAPPTTPPPGTRSETGFAWAPPKAWTRSAKSPSNVHYHSPDGKQEIAASYALARGGDLLTQWQQFERDSHDAPGYRKLRLERTTFRGNPAIIWEYVFTQDGAPWRASQLGFTAGGKSYQLNIWYDAAARRAALTTYDRVTESFTPL